MKTVWTRTEESAEQERGKGDKDVAGSERRWGGRSRHDVCECNPSPTLAKREDFILADGVFLFLNAVSVTILRT